MSNDQIVKAIDKASRELLTEPPRGHLGASQIGGRCARQAWYGFRWAYAENATGRMRRLWNRGHEEEDRLIRWLRATGYEVRDYALRLMYHSSSDSYVAIPWDEDEAHDQAWAECDDVSEDKWHIERAKRLDKALPKDQRLVQQWGFTDHEGHYAGSSDGKIRGPHLPEGWGGCEFKTHKDSSFKDLTKKGVLTSKPVHWVQMQVYMGYMGLTWCLYLAVNKDDDSLYAEVVEFRPEIFAAYRDTAAKIIGAQQAPKRLSEDPSWFECKWCAFREICHKGEAPEKNCRSCSFAQPGPDASWTCGAYRMTIPKDFIPKGCDRWQGVR